MRRGRGLTDLKVGYRISQVAEMVVVFRGMPTHHVTAFRLHHPSGAIMKNRRNWWNYVRKIYLGEEMRNNVVHDSHFHRLHIVSIVGTRIHRVRGAWGERVRGLVVVREWLRSK